MLILKKTWGMIKLLISQNLCTTSIKRIIWNNTEFSNDLDIANAFNQFFCNIASDLDSLLPVSNFDPLSYVIHNSTTSFYLTPVRSSECLSIVKSLKDSKQPINNIPLKMFKLYSEHYIYILCDIINLSFSSGIFPDYLKIAHTVPIFKKGDPTCINNYRPITILHFISKVFEKCLHSRLMNFLASNNILSTNQFGFLKQTSTEDAILKLVEYLYDSLNSKFNSINIFIDFKKAFDTINHPILIKKLEAYGIRGLPLELMTNYLQNRKQFVKIGKTFSNEGEITLGIPQGSVLGPLLFLIYINDLPNLSTRYQTILFADDTTLSFKGDNLPDLVQLCNTELNEFSKWAVANRLSINTEKTFYNVVSNLTNDFNPIDIKLNNHSIIHKRVITFLGVIIDEKLKYKDHINFVCKKNSKSIGILNKLKNLLPFYTMKNLYFALVYPYLNYCNLIWGGTFSTHLHPLIVLQKKVIRIVNNKPFFHHTSELFLNSFLLKLEDINKLNLANYMFKLEIFSAFTSSHEYPTRSRVLLNPSFQRLSITQQSITYRGPMYWNTIPATIKDSSSFHVFKRKVRELLIQSYESS